MFRDLEEYQKLQKLYEEKVSKPKQLDEFTGLGVKGAVKQAQELKSKQGSSFGDSVKMGEKLRSQNNTTTSTTTTETPKKRFQSRFGKKQEPVKSPMEFGMEGDGKKRAQELARKRIGTGTARKPETTIAQANQRNKDIIKDRAIKRNDAFKQKQQEFRDKKRLGKPVGKKYGKPPSMMNFDDSYQYNMEPYDIVLEYLLDQKHAATIEEANYIMTEMDAKTIQDIVSQQLNEQN